MSKVRARDPNARKEVMLVLDTVDAPHSNLSRLPYTENYATADAGYAGPERPRACAGTHSLTDALLTEAGKSAWLRTSPYTETTPTASIQLFQNSTGEGPKRRQKRRGNACRWARACAPWHSRFTGTRGVPPYRGGGVCRMVRQTRRITACHVYMTHASRP